MAAVRGGSTTTFGSSSSSSSSSAAAARQRVVVAPARALAAPAAAAAWRCGRGRVASRHPYLHVASVLSGGGSSSGGSSSGSSDRAAPPPLAAAAATPVAKPPPRDVAAKAGAESSEAVPLPDPDAGGKQPQQQGQAAGGLLPKDAGFWLDQLVDGTVRAPYVWYSRSLEKNPLLTKACTSLVGFVVGDLLAQRLAHPGAAVDVLRCLRLGAYGLLIDGPVGSSWYDVLERYVWPDAPTSTKAVLLKTALDQIVYATVMTAVFFAVIKTLEGQPDAIGATLAAKFWPTLAANYAIWPLAHLINFRFVPSPYRILYNNCVCVAWLTGLSFITHTKINLVGVLHGLGLH